MAEELANAARILSRAATRLATVSPSESSPLPSTVSSPSTSTQAETPGQSRADFELQTLFPHHFSSGNSIGNRNTDVVGGRANFRRHSSQRKRKRNGSQVCNTKTVTRKFFCLADKDQLESPDREEQRELLSAGLGEVKLTVPENADEKGVRDILLKTFPKLKDAGGFELMYVETRKRDLLLIPPGPGGWPMKYLTSFIGQGKVFVRPIQQDLLLEQSTPFQGNAHPAVHKEKCRYCQCELDVHSLREHSFTCGNKSLNTTTTNVAQDEEIEDVDNDDILDIPAFSSILDGEDDPPNGGSIDVPAERGEYGNYVSLIDDDFSIDDNEDPALLAAIEASLVDANRDSDATEQETKSSNGSPPVDVVLKSFQQENLKHSDPDSPVRILISRKSVFSTTIRATERKHFSFFYTPVVTFSGEEAVDDGGPKREYFRLLMMCVQRSTVFHGSWFSHDIGLLNNGKYALAGKLVAWSVLHGGSGLRCLAQEGYNLCKGVPHDRSAAVRAIADAEMKAILSSATACTSEEDFAEFVSKHSDHIAQYGYSNVYMATLKDKVELIDCLLKQYFVYGVHAEYTQFLEGMNSIGNFGNVVMEHEEVFAAILGNKQPKLTSVMFMSLYELFRSEEGSNKRSQEDDTLYCFELFIKDLEEGEVGSLTLEDLLVFITGADAVPPLGFDKEIAIEFYDFSGNVRRRPWSSTCSLTLNLPRGIADPVEFNSLIKESLLDCHGFGKV